MQEDNINDLKAINISELKNTTTTEIESKLNLIDINKYEDKKISEDFNWFHVILLITLMIIAIFSGIIILCLLILFI